MYRQSEKNLLSSNMSSTSPQYAELRPTSGWDRFVSLGHCCKFQRVSHLGSITAWHSSIGRQPNFAALNRGHHQYSARRPSRWALAHISSINLDSVTNEYKSQQRQATISCSTGITVISPSCRRSGWLDGWAPLGSLSQWCTPSTAAGHHSWWSPATCYSVPGLRDQQELRHTGRQAAELAQRPLCTQTNIHVSASNGIPHKTTDSP